mgnify:FL=1|tara:strand:- start:257 stop:466 length:210 start_codon:yes stop_codon:yes gene_type:complete
MLILEPREMYDKAMISEEPIVYSLSILIELLQQEMECEYLDAVDFYCYNIEPLIDMGLEVKDDDRISGE